MSPAVLLVDDELICRDPLTRLLRLQGMDVTAAADGIEALRTLRGIRPGVMVLDLALPRLSGLDVLRVMRRSEEFRDLPVIVLTSSTDQGDMRSAAMLGVTDYVLKPTFSFDDLVARIRRITQQDDAPAGAPPAPPAPGAPPQQPSATAGAPAAKPAPARPKRIPPPSPAPDPQPAGAAAPAAPAAAAAARPTQGAAPVPRLLTRDQVLERVAACAQSKTLAGVVSQVVSIASSPRGTVADLVSLLKQDLVLATRVLQVANTVKYASNKPRIATVEEAVRNIGLSTVRNIAMSAGVFEAFPEARDGFSLIRCWQHSLAVSELLDRLIAGAEGIEPGLAHLVGLCHDLGEVVLRQCLAEQYDALAQVGDGSAVATHQVESAAFGIPYPELVERVLGQLGLPAAIIVPVREHADRRARPTSRLATALQLADNYAHGLQLASSPRAAVAPIGVAEYRAVRGAADGAPLSVDGETLRAGVLASTTLLARLSGAQEAELAKPLVPATRLRVWYARHSALSAFDPLEAALRTLAASVTTHDRLPQPAEGAGYDVLVVAAARAGLAPLSVPDAERAAAAASGGGKRVVYLSGTDAADVPVTSAVVRRYPVPLSVLAGLLSAPQA